MSSISPIPKKILIFGATGVIGKYITQALIDNKSKFEKIGIFTSQSTVDNKKEEIERLKSEGLDVIVGDIRNEGDVVKAYEGYDTVVSALSRSTITFQTQLLGLAERSSTITSFYPSEYGTDITYSPITSPHEKPHQDKLHVRAYIKSSISKLRITYLVTGPYSDVYMGLPLGEGGKAGGFNVKEKKAVLLGSGDDEVSFTTMADVGKLLVASLNTPFVASGDSSPNVRLLKVNSFTTTPHRILAEFEKQTGGEKWSTQYTPLDELKNFEKLAWEKGDPRATGVTLRRIWTEGGTLYEQRDNVKIGDPETEGLEEQVGKLVRK
ncbi:NAD(P)-binding protein [Periconia macrospinosa]|uniref:NAD(P)-binding protein n=1 Tax=Periconia macrospinosa TaxID=97972 RepID=A0A2V1E8M0_9PLEO|nr:NAD(P)-binding protein [Periconia macrospinosa]